MNKSILTLIAFLATTSAYAQTDASINTSTYQLEDSEIKDAGLDGDSTMLQIRAGFGFGTLSNSPSSGSANGMSGMNFGLNADVPVGDASSTFNTGLNFVQKGASVGAQTAVVNYLVLPVQMKAHFGHIDGIRADVGVGPYAALKLSSRLNQNGNGTNLNGLRDFDFGGRFSVGVEVPVDGEYSILVGADYDLGLTDIVEGNNNLNSALRTRTLLTTLGLGIRL